MDDSWFRSQQSPRNEATTGSSFVSPPRNGNRVSQSQTDQRSHLPRRFTTDSSRGIPTLSSVSSGSDYNAQTIHKVQLIEKKKQEYERIREQRRRFELEMQKLDQQSRREAIELAQMEEEMTRVTGHQSEPTTPPEYSSGFSNVWSRPYRNSMSGLASGLISPPAFLPMNRPFRSGSQLMSPPASMQSRHAWDEAAVPSRSVPTTRRNSDDEERDEAFRQDLNSHRSAQTINRYSMPVVRNRGGVYEAELDGTDVTRFLWDEDNAAGHANAVNDEPFPMLVRRDNQTLSASSAALDLALSSTPNPEPHATSNWSSHINRHRTQQSLSSLNGGPGAFSPTGDLGSIGSSRPASLRHSVDLKYIAENGGEPSTTPIAMSGQAGQSHGQNQTQGITSTGGTPPKLQTAFSANDAPMMKNGSSSSATGSNANNHAQQHFHNHNASMGRIPVGIVPHRHTRELSSESNSGVTRDQPATYQSMHSVLQGSAPAFGPSTNATASASLPQTQPQATAGISASANQAQGVPAGYAGFYPVNGFIPQAANVNNPGGYNMNMLTAGMQQMGMNGANGGNMYPQPNQNSYNAYTPGQGPNPGSVSVPGPSPAPFQPANQQQSQPRDSQARVMQSRRRADDEAMSRFNQAPIETFVGQIYELCKDQHGCRYLQRKLEERDPETVHVIWLETNIHVIELMTDPFGNYLCQKLLEFCNDDERTVLFQNASKDMVRIALNQHGTRALQKMIEFVSTPQQVQLIIEALRFRVVELIQDLNGNHVIQKCLNKLTPTDAQFIFDAVGKNCIEVGTHRHGCCVLQRCIDHASGSQKQWLIQCITEHSRILVQDPFGNYVIQYIIDLNEPAFTEPVVAMFQGCVTQLSRHKFSSNVIEKCLRCAQGPSKDMIVDEMLAVQEIERLLRDSYGNYVVQTALDHATPHMKFRLVESIRPILPQIRATPYGRRIQAKISSYDNRSGAASTGQSTPVDNTQGHVSLRATHSRNASGSSNLPTQAAAHTNGGSQVQSFVQAPPTGFAPNTNGNVPVAAPQGQTGATQPVQHQLPQHQQQMSQQHVAQQPSYGQPGPATYQVNGSHTPVPNHGHQMNHGNANNTAEGGEAPPTWM